ncbi:flagellin [Paenibacillus castaneae]|uniref:flagellin N-terminal helical domain-containing protein n=1 Tax=Paenibacillus castaneae TaxID=474957 RepID=UPI0011AF19DF|nr:flagellin [Paenibacillus castaneae]NIK77481.1 flagellin [Paenibacillus castaneae]
MRILHNISALNTLNKLNKNNKATSNSLEKLSSGLRINKAADDAAGLAISEKMKAQIRGLNQSVRNAYDGISLIQTAEDALGQIQNPNLQRMRELAVQAANDTLTDKDRQMLQDEIEQIKKGINDIANKTEFNTKPLINGTYSGQSTVLIEGSKTKISGDINLSGGLTVTAGSNDTLNFDVDGIATSVTLATGTYTSSALLTAINLQLTGSGVTAALSNGKLELSHNSNGIHTIDNFAGNAITSLLISSQSGTVDRYTISGEAPLTPSITITAGVNDNLTFDLDGVNYSITLAANTYNIPYGADPATSPLAMDINNKLALAGAPVKATYGGISWIPTSTLTLTASNVNLMNNFGGNALTTLLDNIWHSVPTPGTPTKVLGSVDLSNGLDIISGKNDTFNFKVDGVPKSIILSAGTYSSSDLLTEINGKLVTEGVGVTASLASGKLILCHNTSGLRTINGFSGNAVTSLMLAKSDGNEEVLSNAETLTLQIGANAGQTLMITIGGYTAENLQIDSIVIDPRDKAEEAITKIDKAIGKISSERSKLGAFQNRLQHTANNLENAVENLTSAESRIRDSDIAKEMMEFTKSNILTQAAQAMLAQANQQPQAVLQLLK